MGGAFPAALVALHEWAGGRTIETLAGGLRLSHSRTVRVVDRLEAAGLATRARDPADGRGVLVRPDAGRARRGAARADARAAALEAALAALDGGDRRELAAFAERAAGRCHHRAPRRRGHLPAVRCPRVRSPRGALPRHAGGGRRRAAR